MLLLALIFGFCEPALAGKNFQRMITVVLENTNYDEAVRQPFLSSLISRGVLLTNFHAVTHPSQGNYIAMISGSTHGVSHDGPVNLNFSHLGDLLESKGLEWRAYADQYPGNCFLGEFKGGYARKHLPFLSFKNVQQNPARCAKVVHSSQFDLDAKNQKLPEYSLFIPDQKNDGHDTGVAYADRWLKSRFERYLLDADFMEGTLFVVTFDEDESILGGGSNQVMTLLVGSMLKTGLKVSDRLTHYSMLQLAENNWGLDSLNLEDKTAPPIAGIWK